MTGRGGGKGGGGERVRSPWAPRPSCSWSTARPGRCRATGPRGRGGRCADRARAEPVQPGTQRLACAAAGRPFAALEAELDLLLDRVADAASDDAAGPTLIGILPTLGLADLGPGMMTDAARYRALSSGLRRLRRDPFRIRSRFRSARPGQRGYRVRGGCAVRRRPGHRYSGGHRRLNLLRLHLDCAAGAFLRRRSRSPCSSRGRTRTGMSQAARA